MADKKAPTNTKPAGSAGSARDPAVMLPITPAVDENGNLIGGGDPAFGYPGTTECESQLSGMRSKLDAYAQMYAELTARQGSVSGGKCPPADSDCASCAANLAATNEKLNYYARLAQGCGSTAGGDNTSLSECKDKVTSLANQLDYYKDYYYKDGKVPQCAPCAMCMCARPDCAACADFSGGQAPDCSAWDAKLQSLSKALNEKCPAAGANGAADCGDVTAAYQTRMAVVQKQVSGLQDQLKGKCPSSTSPVACPDALPCPGFSSKPCPDPKPCPIVDPCPAVDTATPELKDLRAEVARLKQEAVTKDGLITTLRAKLADAGN